MDCRDYRLVANALHKAHRDMKNGLGIEQADAAFVAVLDRMIQAFGQSDPKFKSMVFEISAWGGLVTVFRDGTVDASSWQRCEVIRGDDH